MLSTAVAHRLSEAHLRPTVSRIQVLELFVHNPELRASIEQVYTELETRGTPLGITNVYRIVKALQEHGLLDRDWVQGRTSPVSIYALRCEPQARQQHRWLCTVCARRVDGADDVLQRELERVSGDHGFVLATGAVMTLPVICKACATGDPD